MKMKFPGILKFQCQKKKKIRKIVYKCIVPNALIRCTVYARIILPMIKSCVVNFVKIGFTKNA